MRPFADIAARAASLLGDASAGAVRVRLQTLITIRWIAVAGQLVTLLVVHFGFGFTLPLVPALIAVAASAALNAALPLVHRGQPHVGDRDAAIHLAFDCVQLAVLLFLTGGLANPFEVLILAPVTVSATILSRRSTLLLAALAVVLVTVLAFWHLPLPGPPGQVPPPGIMLFAVWIATVLAILFIASVVARVAAEQRRMRDALAEAQAALAREQQLSALGALAAAAAHELGTPLATISVVAKELARDLPPDSDLSDDATLLLSQAERCRDILAELARRPVDDAGEAYYRAPLSALIEAAAVPHRRDAIALEIVRRAGDAGPEPRVERRPELVHGIGNLLSNALQFAERRVEVAIAWTASSVRVTIADDGPGFPPMLLARFGEPYISSRSGESGHMGLGVFIAQTLLHRTGARLVFGNRQGYGAEVVIEWPRDVLEGGASSDRDEIGERAVGREDVASR